MTYTVQQLAELTGLTPRTLRYYDSVGLLRPRRDKWNDYRLYDQEQVDRLYRILVYREMGLPLEEIGGILDGGDEQLVLKCHLDRLEQERLNVESRLEKVRMALAGKGEKDMDFEKRKQQALRENEERYGAEIREKYGEATVEDSNRRFAGMSEEMWDAATAAEKAYLEKLKEAMLTGDPAGEAAREACRLHLAWLRFYWKAEQCTAQAHKGVVLMYDQDERFRAYYEKVAPGCAEFFGKAICCYYE